MPREGGASSTPRRQSFPYNARHGVLDRPVEPGDDGGVCNDELRERMSV